MKMADITLRIPVDQDLDTAGLLTLAAVVRQLILDNGGDDGIEEVQIAEVKFHPLP